MMRAMTTVAATVLLFTAACGAAPEPTSQEPTMTTPTSGNTPPSENTPPSDLVTQAKTDLAARLGIDVAQVTVVSSTEVTWPDGSLGCPQPGMHYTQALIEGTQTILEANGTRYNYHSGGAMPPFLCTS
jgi:hypothetical protein